MQLQGFYQRWKRGLEKEKEGERKREWRTEKVGESSGRTLLARDSVDEVRFTGLPGLTTSTLSEVQHWKECTLTRDTFKLCSNLLASSSRSNEVCALFFLCCRIFHKSNGNISLLFLYSKCVPSVSCNITTYIFYFILSLPCTTIQNCL